jgi:hypothetical protein
MARRYSRILQAARYYSAIDNYIKYITDSSKRGSRVGTGTPRVASKILYIRPYAIDLGANTLAQVSGAETTWNARQAIFALNTKDVLPASTVAIKVDGYRAPRVVIMTGRGAGVKKISQVTGMPYLDYGGKSTSLPFGKASLTATDTLAEDFAQIKADIIQATAGAFVSLTPEKI